MKSKQFTVGSKLSAIYCKLRIAISRFTIKKKRGQTSGKEMVELEIYPF